jgi:putative transposase
MAQKKYTVEQIIVKLREVELLCNKGNTIAEAARQAGITEQTYYRWWNS